MQRILHPLICEEEDARRGDRRDEGRADAVPEHGHLAQSHLHALDATGLERVDRVEGGINHHARDATRKQRDVCRHWSDLGCGVGSGGRVWGRCWLGCDGGTRHSLLWHLG